MPSLPDIFGYPYLLPGNKYVLEAAMDATATESSFWRRNVPAFTSLTTSNLERFVQERLAHRIAPRGRAEESSPT
jgi:hypothetical protein